MYGLVDELAEFDLVHTIETFQGFSEQAIEAKKKHGCNVVCTVFENIPYFAESNHYSRTWRESLKHRNADSIKQTVREGTDAFIAMSDRAKTALEIEGISSEDIHLIPLGVDADRFEPGAVDDEVELPGGLEDDSTLNVVYVGRYTWEKGVFDLLSTWKQVCDTVDEDVTLTMVGWGPDKDQVEAFARHAEIPNVEICGPVDYEQMPCVYNAADLTVVPSLPSRFWQEQYGRVVVESQACGTPVLASRTGGIPYAMGDHGVLAQPGDPHDWTEKICSLLSNSARRNQLGRKARAHVESERTIENTARQVEAVYDDLM
jgi:glycosyltransferase involved in cell wall biosynthesis